MIVTLEYGKVQCQKKTAIVTGAGAGVGKATAVALLEAGWSVVFCGRTRTTLEAAASSSTQGDGRALVVPCDVTSPDDVKVLFETTLKSFGRVDLLFNNAGSGYPSTLIDEIPVEAWNQVVAVNLTGRFSALGKRSASCVRKVLKAAG